VRIDVGLFGLISTQSLDHLICSHQHVWWNREADLLCGFQIDHQFELSRLLNSQVGGFCAFQDLREK
jgi:hypothetical protein